MENEILWGTYGKQVVTLSDGRRYKLGEGIELKSRIPIEVYNENTRNIGARPKEEIEAKAREQGANVIINSKGFHYLYHLRSDAKQIVGANKPDTMKSKGDGAQTKLLTWGRPYFNQEGELGKRFGVKLEGLERVIFLENLEHLGTLPEYKLDRGQVVARNIGEVEEHVREKYGAETIIVPSSVRKKNKARLNFYKLRKIN